jgi:hypothetical protein
MEEIQKTLDQISWNVPESVYREDPALSYSTLARYEREGFDKLDSLFDQISTPSLTQGSMVDALITGGEDEFNERFYVADFPPISETQQQIADTLFDKYRDQYAGFSAIPADKVVEVSDSIGWNNRWGTKSKMENLTKSCSQYYNLKYLSGDKEIVSASTYAKVLAMVNALKDSPSTRNYFMPDEPFSNVKRYYQLKFKATLEGIDYRIMMDESIVDYEHKKILPIDLKTSGHSEHTFMDSFIKWCYMIQSRLYWRVLRDNLDRDPYFKDFELLDYRFIVVNRETLTPLVWEFPLTKVYGVLVDKEGNEYRDPFVIGKELRHYLDDRPAVPDGININGVNIINCLKLKEE